MPADAGPRPGLRALRAAPAAPLDPAPRRPALSPYDHDAADHVVVAVNR
jgi:hypothetical protein